MRKFTEGFYAYAFAMAVCLAGVGVFLLITPQSRTERIPAVDYSFALADLRRTAPYQVWAPERVPEGWVPTSSKATKEKGTATWRLGFATAKRPDADRSHAMLAQSNEQPAAGFASRLANTSQVTGTVQVGGVSWEQRVREDKDQRSLVRVLPDVTIVVTGTASWEELSTLAGSLKQQEKITS
ncbi:hypothetical protein FHS43_004748 [Streptosporangium becharense]|uniref:DUF4245 domain-containing protein n=1 Tax=Streptosporangium becharense TaxID=1816182 RepID=A0A7W9II18_9ACTN|nr:DUF4245 domain-containing protein [Streptosporangium becharense]MBB2913444.1 hypothetical protein [Streptosporangium becharense]MBB5821134.1 hypothetical protein [Streptosporangium becharense]